MNILFVLYGDFSSNSAHPLALYARELQQNGHSCAVAVPNNLETAQQYPNAFFRPLLYSDVLNAPDLVFSDGRPADIIHCWTPREVVRRFVTSYMAKRPTPLMIYLEDHESWIASQSLGLEVSTLILQTEQSLSERVPDSLSHPFRYDSFIGLADAVAVIQDKLEIEVPPWVYCETVMPGVDLEFFFPRPANPVLRKQYGVVENERVIVYHGGLNRFTRPSIETLCRAVYLINKQGYPCRLLRTGPFALDFIGQLPPEAAAAINDLGVLPRSELPDLLALADVFVQPGKIDPFEDLRLPGKLPEFFAMGRAVVMPNANIAHLLTDGVDVILTWTGSAEEIAAKCIGLFSDSQQADRIGHAGRQFAEKYFDVKEQSKKLATVYKIACEKFSPAIAAEVWRSRDENTPITILLACKLRLLADSSSTNLGFETGEILREHARYIESMQQRVKGLEAGMADRDLHLHDKDVHIGNLEVHLDNLKDHVDYLSRAINGRDGLVRDKDVHIGNLEVHLGNLKEHIGYLSHAISERDGLVRDKDVHIGNLSQAISERDATLSRRDGQIVSLAQAVHDKDVHIGNLEIHLGNLQEHIAYLSHSLREREEHINRLIQTADAIRRSTSWRLTFPVRFAGRQLLRIRIVVKALPYALSVCGGYRGLIEHAWLAYKNEGVDGIKRRILFSASPSELAPLIGDVQLQPNYRDYNEWVRRYDTLTGSDREKISVRISQLQNPPLISVVMPVYNPPLNMLEDAIRSVQGQLYPNWELCIADDASTDEGVRKLLKRYTDNDSRIKVVFRKKNGHISAASNSALKLVKGEYVALLDNDDLLREHALFWVAEAIAANPDAGLIYSDEDKLDESGVYYDPYFKPEWNPDLLLSHNMICHLGVYRADLVRKLGGFRKGYEGAQDYDLALRCTEQLSPHQIVHIPRVLYHWSCHPGSTAQAGSEKSYALSAGERALNEHFSRTHVSAKAELLDFGMYRARYTLSVPMPLISLVIPTRNGLHLIKQCIESIIAKTTYENYEILIVDNNSDDPETLAYFSGIEDNRIRIIRDESPFNYSALNNAAVGQARGEYVGLINNDIEVISPEWLDEMMGLAIQPGVGAVGARLWYPNDTLQHGGVISGLGGVAGHSHKHLPRDAPGYFYRAQLIQTLSAVTAACLVIKKSIYQEVGGLDEVNLTVAFNDVDFCLRVREAGYRNVWTPYAELYHHESATRGYEDTPEKCARFNEEVLYMQQRWETVLMHDPAYSPNLTLDREDFSYAWPPRIDPI